MIPCPWCSLHPALSPRPTEHRTPHPTPRTLRRPPPPLQLKRADVSVLLPCVGSLISAAGVAALAGGPGVLGGQEVLGARMAGYQLMADVVRGVAVGACVGMPGEE